MRYKRILFYLALATGVILLSLGISVFLFKDRIIRQFITEANKHLNTPVKVKNIDVAIFKNFPYLSIVMTDVYIEDSHPGEYPLFTADELAFRLNPYEVYNGEYNIKGLSISGSETNLKITNSGQTNYDILKPSAGGTTTSSMSLELRDVILRETRFAYSDLRAKQRYLFVSEHLDASVKTDNDLYFIDTRGDVVTELLEISGKSFVAGKSFTIASNLVYDDNLRILQINPSLLKLRNSVFSVAGSYGWKSENLIDLEIEGKDTDIQTLLTLLPEHISSSLSRYKSKGDVYFSSRLKGRISGNELPALEVSFGFSNTTIFHPEYRSRIESARLKGSFSSDNVASAKQGKLVLNDIRGTLNGEPFQASFSLTDFNNPLVNCVFKGNVDAAALHGFFPLQNITDVSGGLLADVSFRGRIELLKSKTTAQQVTTRGTIDLKGISFRFGRDKVLLKDLAGNLQFSNNDLALSNVTAKFGNSDFVFNGFFKNVITFLLFENQPVGIESDLKSDFLDVNQLMRIGYGSADSGSEPGYEFDISKNVFLNFNCDVKRLVYKRFTGEQIKGDLLVKNKVAVSRKLSLNTMGGQLTLSGIVDSNNPKAIDVIVSSHLTNIHLDSAFYVFENFNQDFILDKHLKGHVTADVSLEMTLNQNLRLFPETLIADIDTKIRNGELNNFEPMQKLNRFVDDEGLSRLRFSDLQNEIHIENKAVYIPKMLIGSNVTDIQISGKHTFDQRIDYRLVTPLRGRRKFTNGQAGNALESDDAGQTRLYLKITGTTDDYKIGFDTEAVKNKIVDDIKKEFRDIKEGFKNREKEREKVLEVQEDEYFDW